MPRLEAMADSASALNQENMMNRSMWPARCFGTVWLSITGLLCVPFTSWAANECAIEFKAGNQTVTKNVSAGQTFTYSPAVSGLSWVRNTKARPIDVQITNLTPVGPNPKWVTLPVLNARDPLSGNYSGSVKLYKVRCRSLSFPDTQNTPAPGGSVPIPYPNIGQ
jgi:hypothetical protein